MINDNKKRNYQDLGSFEEENIVENEDLEMTEEELRKELSDESEN